MNLEDLLLKILWVNNIAIPKIAEAVGIRSVPVGGWMVKLADEISGQTDVELSVAFPLEKRVDGKVDLMGYHSFNVEKKSKVSDKTTYGRIIDILKITDWDCIHIFGTEYIHSFLFTKAAIELGIIDKVVISIQGLASVCAKHFYAGLPLSVIYGFSKRDLYKGNIYAGKTEFEKLGQFEKAAIKSVRHIIGRTDWDRMCTFLIAPEAKYHFNNEMLRDSFYTAEPWCYEKCNQHSVFMSQATLPLKGLHFAIQAVTILKPWFPDIKIRIAGKSFTQKPAYQRSKYEQYILGLMEKNGIDECVEFTGFLNEFQMVEEYRKCNVYVCASSIENSPNSLCEAMILGTPVVTSLCGGVENLLTHGQDGFIYQSDAPYMLAYYLRQIFESKEKIATMGKNAREKALKRHNVQKIVDDLIDIYKEISKE